MVAGLVWGSRNGVQFSLTFVALKALPVLILGGFTSVPGVIVAGLIVGAAEKIAEVYAGPFVGGGIEGWLPYVLAVLFLLVRPEGLESGQFSTSYVQDRQLLQLRQDRIGMVVLLAAGVVGIPFFASDYWLSAILIPWLVLALVALGQNILMGYAGQLSLGSAGFMAAGAFACYNLILRVPGIPFVAAVLLSGLIAAVIGILFGLPSL
eukprot:gene1651-2162_t